MSNIPRPDLLALANTADHYLVEMNGPNGLFYIAPVGSMPERAHTFFYSDNVSQFFFYLDLITEVIDESIKYNITINNATIKRFTGPRWPMKKLEAGIKESIEQNMIIFFSQRSPSTGTIYKSGCSVGMITFTWAL